ncbi:MAG: hypothetical protein A2W18_07155 [Candidatus Muproteobacteria bacterium RBG_16_60_9]|uniref:Uncharacterized protein n=1 Tax=Candidatus Muproteobacteria bacterium RBG_16_60_9 TaxID=1817755 RepID=A0A1F6VI01_9PROT|nr:MAG: hypothetical protein A2W18_07155 [Candidatus Muproteobacteria bacterium RBG_16_60_9]
MDWKKSSGGGVYAPNFPIRRENAARADVAYNIARVNMRESLTTRKQTCSFEVSLHTIRLSGIAPDMTTPEK